MTSIPMLGSSEESVGRFRENRSSVGASRRRSRQGQARYAQRYAPLDGFYGDRR